MRVPAALISHLDVVSGLITRHTLPAKLLTAEHFSGELSQGEISLDAKFLLA